MTRQHTEPLRVCIDARLIEGISGGVESVVIGMAHALSQLEGSGEEYLFLAWPDEAEWIAPYVFGPCRMLFATQAPRSRLRNWMSRAVNARPASAFRPLLGHRAYRVDRSDGTIERAGVDIMHLTIQSGFLTDIPSIYHPHDLQHRHFPENFSVRDRVQREIVYRTLCNQAEMVSVTSSWVKADVVQQFGVPEDKICVVPLAPVLTAYPEPSSSDFLRAKASYHLPDRFFLYPAQTWIHKNHMRLLDALALLRDREGIKIPLVCCGGMNDHFLRIHEHKTRLRLSDQVHFIGLVSPVDLQALYRLATAVVIPSKFEAASGPLWDAFLSGVPAACSKVTSLPQQAGDAALLFNPEDAEEIARSLKRLWRDVQLRRRLVARGKENVSRFTWERTVRHFRAHYRRIAGRALSDQDQEILAAPPLL